eukprot:m.78470 g.78470  ORF g.78470 m.78470 type:complete len:390 (+) comp8578_c0_seq1:155-1324(+)
MFNNSINSGGGTSNNYGDNLSRFFQPQQQPHQQSFDQQYHYPPQQQYQQPQQQHPHYQNPYQPPFSQTPFQSQSSNFNYQQHQYLQQRVFEHIQQQKQHLPPHRHIGPSFGTNSLPSNISSGNCTNPHPFKKSKQGPQETSRKPQQQQLQSSPSQHSQQQQNKKKRKKKKTWHYDEEEIKEWRAARRKNYPTDANIEKKKSDEAEWERAGVAAETNFSYRQGAIQGRTKKSSSTMVEKAEVEETPQTMGKGLVDYALEDDDEDDASDCEKGPSELKNLDANTMRLEAELRMQKDGVANEIFQKTIVEKEKLAREKRKERRKQNQNNKNKDQDGSNIKDNDGRKKKFSKTTINRPSLLRMLLEEEMKTESIFLLQCVRHTIANNFFMKEM